MFIETGCELVSEVSLEVKGEVTKMDIALFAPHMGTCVWFNESGNRCGGDNMGQRVDLLRRIETNEQ